jgi:hypothetical protein
LSIHVRDAEATVTFPFDRGSLVVHGSARGLPTIRISADAESVLGLCMVKIVRGVPHPLHHHKRVLLARILKGEIRVECIPRSPLQLMRFTGLMSVRD